MRNLKSNIFVIALLFACFSLQGQAVVNTPRRSPRAQFSQTFGITKVSIDYGAPKVKVGNNDRTGKIWGQQVPYGFQKITFAGKGEIPWRAGADENTTITFSTDVKVEGKPLAAGTYGFHIALHEDNKATLIFSNNSSSWGSFWYNEAEDALRVKVDMEDAEFQNVLNYSAIELDGLYTKLALSWEKKRIPFSVEANTLQIVENSLKEELRGQSGFGWLGKFQAAQYLVRFNHNIPLAEQWINESIATNKNYQNLQLKSIILFQQQKMEEVMVVLDEASTLADINQLNAMGYTLMQNNLLEKAIEMFELNVKRNPNDANVLNSLGEALVAKGGKSDKKRAIKLFQKSNSLNPAQLVKDSNDKNLADLGAK
ncbi:MAG: DUF2911 domain-containing protein [Roseivirga sp.]|nr:DUF2911 domain-containing protein [Roseivirga sp.]